MLEVSKQTTPRSNRLVPEPKRDPLERFGTAMTLAAGQSLFAEGDEAHYYYKVVSGAVRSYTLLPDGRRQISDFFVPGDFFGLTDLDVHQFGAEAITAANLIRYRRTHIDKQVIEEPSLAEYLMGIACANLSSARLQLVLLGRKTAEERIASFLLSLLDRIGSVAADEATIQLPMSRADIADYLGLTIETVSRTLTSLARRRLLTLPFSHTVHLTDREALEDLAAGLRAYACQ